MKDIATLKNGKVMQVYDVDSFVKREKEIEELDRAYYMARMGIPAFFIGLCAGCGLMFAAFIIGTFVL